MKFGVVVFFFFWSLEILKFSTCDVFCELLFFHCKYWPSVRFFLCKQKRWSWMHLLNVDWKYNNNSRWRGIQICILIKKKILQFLLKFNAQSNCSLLCFDLHHKFNFLFKRLFFSIQNFLAVLNLWKITCSYELHVLGLTQKY